MGRLGELPFPSGRGAFSNCRLTSRSVPSRPSPLVKSKQPKYMEEMWGDKIKANILKPFLVLCTEDEHFLILHVVSIQMKNLVISQF